MAVYLSPGVFPREIDISLIPSAQGALRPAFIGSAKKGPMDTPTLITTAAQFIDTFGEPFPESYLGYAVMAFMQEGNACYVQRVGVGYTEGMDAAIAIDAIDTSGARKQGWGRIPVYAGIDYGKIFLRAVNATDPVVVHGASVDASATTGSDAGNDDFTAAISGTYTGCYDETFTIRITGDASASDGIDGAKYQITSTTGGVIAGGQLLGGTGEVDDLAINYGLTITIASGSAGASLKTGFIFTFSAAPDNADLRISVEGGSDSLVTIATATYTTAAALVAAINNVLPSGAEFEAVVDINSSGESVPTIRTTDDGKWLQITGTCAGCVELGISQYSYDIPRSYLLGNDSGPTYNFSSANNRVVVDVIQASSTRRLDFTVNSGANTSTADLVSLLSVNGTVGGTTYFEAKQLTVPGGTVHPLIITPHLNKYDQLKMQVTWTFLATTRFAEEIGIPYPYTKSYQSFWDTRTSLPDVGTDGSTPDSCDTDSPSYDAAQCILDTAYYQNIVGWFVAKTPGTWSDGYSIGLELYTEGIGDAAGRYKVVTYDNDGVAVDVAQDVSFDPADTRYIANVLNDGGVIAGLNGNAFYQWEMRPSFLTGDVRNPSPFRRMFVGGANGIPSDAAYSEALDNAVIGNPALATGINALGNPESYDFNLLLIPGFTSGSVIGQALQFCENRGDILFLVDPPYGYRPQQVIEWHNGMLTSDLANAINSSYGALYWGWLKVSDQFNGGTIWIPPSGHVASVFARTAREAEQWFAPAGINRGRLLTPIDVEYNPTLGERDALYGNGNAVNPIVRFAQEGITIWGQRTLNRRSSATDRVNVRMLMIYVKKNLTKILRAFIFEPNDRTTRRQVVATSEPFLSDVTARRGLTAFKVVCDETNNTPERIDRNELWVSIFLQPTRATEFIALNIVAMKTGASFSAQEVLVAGGVVVQQ